MGCISNKVAYYTRTHAKQAAKKIKAGGNGNRSYSNSRVLPAKMYEYYCKKCGWWHLTSKKQ